MPSILPDFEYDIFISYRQNDNKRDGWVSNFVAALKDELEATLKNPVSIYFDENPHDGLLETHQVNASLEKKLKCLVFIPIISQTYCDVEGYAWSQEFLPFLERAQSDSLGINISLESGNVASRILPIRIHDLDSEDQNLLEEKLDGPLRAIDFIYREPGVNRPLKHDDDRKLNQEKTSYQNQINKVANALKDIGRSVVQTVKQPADSSPGQEKPVPHTRKSGSRKARIALAFALVAIISLLAYSFLGGIAESEPTNKSIAVLPFRNDSDDPDNIYFCNGLMEDIINQLSKIPDVRVPSATSMLYYRENPKPYSEIIEDLDVSYLLEASVRKTNNRALMNITLIDAEQNEQIWTERMEMDLEVKDLFDIQYEVASTVANKMRIAIEDKITLVPTDNYQAYDHYLRARDLLRIWDLEVNREAISVLHRAINLDGDFIDAIALLGQAYGQRAELGYGGTWVDSTRYYSTIAYEKDKKNASAVNAYAYAHILEGDPGEALKLYLDGYKLKPNDTYNYAGWCYFQLGQFDKAIEWAKINIDLDPQNSIYYVDLVNATNVLQLFEYTEYYSKEAFKINPVHTFVNDNLLEMETIKGNYEEAIGYLQKNFEIIPDSIWLANQAPLYYKLGDYDMAETRLTGAFLDEGIKENIDENSKVEIYKAFQYRALIELKKGNEAKGMNDLKVLAQKIDADMKDSKGEKFFLLAGCYAVLGDHDISINYLRKAEEVGFNRYVDYLQCDLLDPIRSNVEFIELLASVKERNDAMRERVISNGYLED